MYQMYLLNISLLCLELFIELKSICRNVDCILAPEQSLIYLIRLVIPELNYWREQLLYHNRVVGGLKF